MSCVVEIFSIGVTLKRMAIIFVLLVFGFDLIAKTHVSITEDFAEILILNETNHRVYCKGEIFARFDNGELLTHKIKPTTIAKNNKSFFKIRSGHRGFANAWSNLKCTKI